jgi:hypothetical protein
VSGVFLPHSQFAHELVEVGDYVEQDEEIASIETDKVRSGDTIQSQAN